VVEEWNDELDPPVRAAVKFISLHPYRTSADRAASQPHDVSARNQFRDAEEVVESLNKPIWVTEVGTTNERNCDPAECMQQPPTYVGSSAITQGFWDYVIYDALRNAGSPLTLVHRFADVPSTQGLFSSEYGFGAVDSSLDAKYGYCLLAQERTQVYPPNPPNTEC
jgi:hypothetical protein